MNLIHRFLAIALAKSESAGEEDWRVRFKSSKSGNLYHFFAQYVYSVAIRESPRDSIGIVRD